MAYDRYDTRRDRDWRESDYERGRRDERGFFERAGDEVASWFGDEDAERRRREDARMNRGSDRDRDFDRDRYAYRSSNRDFGRNRSYDEDRSSRPMNWTSSDRDYRSGYAGYDRDYSGRGGYGASSYGSSGFGAGAGYGSSGYGAGRPDVERREWGGDRDRDYRPLTGDYGRSESPYGRDEYRRTSYAGSGRDNDRHYHAWRQRQLDDLDRDYDEYHRERQEHFENDFGTWRQNRQQKRGMLGQIREHMDVVGSDGETIGKVDHVRGDHIILTKSDSDDNRHHSIKCSMIDRVEGDQVRLDMPAEEAKSRWADAEAEMERSGRVNLERSFSGTYT